jgi:hypothetical protein
VRSSCSNDDAGPSSLKPFNGEGLKARVREVLDAEDHQAARRFERQEHGS